MYYFVLKDVHGKVRDSSEHNMITSKKRAKELARKKTVEAFENNPFNPEILYCSMWYWYDYHTSAGFIPDTEPVEKWRITLRSAYDHCKE